tara:strand:+ start:915 stop:2696 length:1782 start_codon:yes stop_codon:yes gene_type:complete
MIDNIKKIYKILSNKERKKAFFLLILILFSATLDVIGIASIVPLIALLSNPGLIENNIIINHVYVFFKFQDPKIFLFYTGVVFFIVFVISMILRSLTVYLQVRFSLMCEYSVGKRLLQSYLYQSYSWFLNKHSSDLAKNILSTVNLVVNRGLLSTLQAISQSLVILLIILLLFLVDPKLTLIVGLILVTIYGITFKSFSNILNLKGSQLLKMDKERYTALSNSFGSIKETKLRNLENFYISNFSISAKNFAKNQSTAQIISQLPRYLFEAIAFGGLLLIILYLMKQSNSFTAILPVLSLYVFAGYRLMPAVQQLYSALTSIRFAETSINSVFNDLNVDLDYNIQTEKLTFKRDISLNNITFNYPNSNKTNLNNVSINIPIKTTVGLVGLTGSGKTTLADVILGLLKPLKGDLKVDDTKINRINLTKWQRNIGYVPQQIFLTDQSVTSNIAFGIDTPLIDHQAVEEAAKIANLHDFVINDLKNKYETIIGERGIRLSGGQRQRIGIARALYHKPSLLILDEATNALDGLTEKAVMDAVHNLSSKITVILIAHRLNTVKKCDKIFLMEKGKIIANGNYDQLLKSNQEFKKLISVK